MSAVARQRILFREAMLFWIGAVWIGLIIFTIAAMTIDMPLWMGIVIASFAAWMLISVVMWAALQIIRYITKQMVYISGGFWTIAFWPISVFVMEIVSEEVPNGTGGTLC
jgi:hypothetical protein